jgi:ribosome-associated toxin RatA of RatAB toxin-antitoxin module
MIKSVLHLAFPRDQVYDVLSNFGEYEQWFPGCTRSKVVASAGNRTDIATTVVGMKTVHMEVRFEEEPRELVRFNMTKGKDFKTYAGEHRLLDAANGLGTVIITEADVDAGALVPKFMLDIVVRRVLDEIGQRLAERVKVIFAGAATAGSRRVEPKRRRRRILQIVNTPAGTRIWYMGKVYGGKP